MAAPPPPVVPPFPHGLRHPNLELELDSAEDFHFHLTEAINAVSFNVVSMKIMYDVGWTYLAEWEMNNGMTFRTFIPDFITHHALCVDLTGQGHLNHHSTLKTNISSTQSAIKHYRTKIQGINPFLKRQLKHAFPNMRVRGDPFEFWAYEYVKHGILSGLSLEQYLQVIWIFYQSIIYGLNLEFNRTTTVQDLLNIIQAKLSRHTTQLKVIDSAAIYGFIPPDPCDHILRGFDVKVTPQLEITSFNHPINPPPLHSVYVPFPFENEKKFPWRI